MVLTGTPGGAGGVRWPVLRGPGGESQLGSEMGAVPRPAAPRPPAAARPRQCVIGALAMLAEPRWAAGRGRSQRWSPARAGRSAVRPRCQRVAAALGIVLTPPPPPPWGRACSGCRQAGADGLRGVDRFPGQFQATRHRSHVPVVTFLCVPQDRTVSSPVPSTDPTGGGYGPACLWH